MTSLDDIQPPFILDSNVIRPLFKYYYPEDLFPDLWDKFNELLRKGDIISVDEVKTECTNDYNEKDPRCIWIKVHSDIFYKPTGEEIIFLSEIVSHKEFQMSQKDIEKGKNEADPYLIVKAKATGGCVVTDEKYQPHGRKIPTICERYGIPCISRIDFLRILLKKT